MMYPKRLVVYEATNPKTVTTLESDAQNELTRGACEYRNGEMVKYDCRFARGLKFSVRGNI